MRALLAEPFYLCAEHGVWFDKDYRQSFERVLAAEIAEHRESRREKLVVHHSGDEGDVTT